MNLISRQDSWIPCDETVEIPDYKVLACDKYGEEMIGYIDYDKNDQWICESDAEIMYDAVAWMQLPTPYQGGHDE
jgi:hypothetical protein